MKVICLKCGLESEGNFCNKCGAPLQQADPGKQEPQKAPEAIWTKRCPVCQSGELKETEQKKLFGLYHSKNITCDKCSAVFMADGDKYKLTDVNNKLLPIWQEYNNQSLSPEDWKNISYGGMSHEKRRQIDMELYMTKLRDGKASIKITMGGFSPSIILKQKEEVQVLLPDVALREARSVRTTSGGYAGPSFKVAKGVYFRTGAFGAQSQSHDELKELDQGRLTLTNKRFIFTGSVRSSEISLSKIIAMEPYTDGIAIEISGRSKTQYFVWKDFNNVNLTIDVDGREYQEPFTGLTLKYIIEGTVNREANKR